jgi:hypothetical protein
MRTDNQNVLKTLVAATQNGPCCIGNRSGKHNGRLKHQFLESKNRLPHPNQSRLIATGESPTNLGSEYHRESQTGANPVLPTSVGKQVD